MSGLEIREMRESDAEAVAALDDRCFQVSWGIALFQSELISPVSVALVALRDRRIVGYLCSTLVMDEAHIGTLGVEPELQGLGIGGELMAAFLKNAAMLGCRRVTLEVRASNLSAQRLYRRLGFSPISIRRRYYTDNDEDAVVMWIEDLRDRAAQTTSKSTPGADV